MPIAFANPSFAISSDRQWIVVRTRRIKNVCFGIRFILSRCRRDIKSHIAACAFVAGISRNSNDALQPDQSSDYLVADGLALSKHLRTDPRFRRYHRGG